MCAALDSPALAQSCVQNDKDDPSEYKKYSELWNELCSFKHSRVGEQFCLTNKDNCIILLCTTVFVSAQIKPS